MNTAGGCSTFFPTTGGALTPCPGNPVMRYPSITQPMQVTTTYPCPCCGGTGRLRDPKPGEFVDVDTDTPPPGGEGGGE